MLSETFNAFRPFKDHKKAPYFLFRQDLFRNSKEMKWLGSFSDTSPVPCQLQTKFECVWFHDTDLNSIYVFKADFRKIFALIAGT